MIGFIVKKNTEWCYYCLCTDTYLHCSYIVCYNYCVYRH